MNEIKFENGKTIIKNAKNFNIAQTFECGQAFRWNMNEKGIYCGIASGNYAEIYNDGNDIVIESDTSENSFVFWSNYFDLNRDYGTIIKKISDNETLKKAAGFGSGIRILSQEPWEALCSFIISQNNNIPRIKGIIERLCKEFGKQCENGFAFPSAEVLSGLTPEDLAPLRCGFRARYIIDAAKKVSTGEIDLEALKSCDEEKARKTLMGITGVGPKVADCTMLFGLGRIDSFPKDVWIKRAMDKLFPNGLPDCAAGYEGIVQQYIFFYSRSGNLPKE